jgi:hypothetical protein
MLASDAAAASAWGLIAFELGAPPSRFTRCRARVGVAGNRELLAVDLTCPRLDEHQLREPHFAYGTM